ncbi:uncharacterized protein LOC131845557 [Achroia grisella]|uniref:uncharacterized protein LOC131845557 n=1 Tax=Achroia grisella TaxID=688607 RepID=UPI0027D3170D|nr:uncharacterized protein LOC131845557 [Achroia grisella]
MNELKILLFILSVIIYCLYSVHMWFMKDTIEENNTEVSEAATSVDILEATQENILNDGTEIKKQAKTKVIPLFLKNGCSVLEVFTQKPIITDSKKEPKIMEGDTNAIAVIGITVFLVILALNALLDVLKVREEEKARRKLNPDGERRQSLSEFANKKSLRRESSKFGLQLFQIAESFISPNEEKKTNRQTRPYTRGESTTSYFSEKRTQHETSAPASISETSCGESKLVKRQSAAKLFDNKLQWLPQKPVFNYHHCEFRFWWNINLKSIPYSLWYHMFRGQQTRSLNIGCLKIPTYHSTSENNRSQLKFNQDSKQWEFYVDRPPQYNVVLRNSAHNPPSLLEICKRLLYEIINDTAKKKTKAHQDNIDSLSGRLNYNRNLGYIENNLEEININEENVNNYDVNGNNALYLPQQRHVFDRSKIHRKDYYVARDIVENYFSCLPKFMKTELSNGPISKCENVLCKRPVFDYVYYEFCFGKIILIDNTEDIVLSAVFCSKSCADMWKIGRVDLIPWSILTNKR